MNMGFLYHNLPDNKHDKNGNLKKLSRDLYSGWTIKNNKHHYGLKEHDNAGKASLIHIMKNRNDLIFSQFTFNFLKN